MNNKIGNEQILELINLIDVPLISDDINFWLIRTQSGMYYDEFISENFVALGWNYLKEEQVKESKKSKEDRANILEFIQKEYDSKQPGMILNKSDRFINGIKENDIIMIPSEKSEKITFALAKEYYEDTSLESKEYENEALIESGWSDTLEIKCPYSKRRKIEIIKTISNENLNPNLYRALVSYHGLSQINDSSSYILSSIYPIYYYKDNLSIIFRVRSRAKIDALDYSSFLLFSSSILQEFNPSNTVSVKSNVQSPGDIIIEIADFGIDALKDNLLLILGLWAAIGGGKFLGFEFHSFADIIISFKEHSSKMKNEELDRKVKQIDIEDRKLDTEIKKIDLDNKKIDFQLRSISLFDKYDQVKKSSNSLEIDTAELTNIIDFTKYRVEKEIDTISSNDIND